MTSSNFNFHTVSDIVTDSPPYGPESHFVRVTGVPSSVDSLCHGRDG